MKRIEYWMLEAVGFLFGTRYDENHVRAFQPTTAAGWAWTMEQAQTIANCYPVASVSYPAAMEFLQTSRERINSRTIESWEQCAVLLTAALNYLEQLLRATPAQNGLAECCPECDAVDDQYGGTKGCPTVTGSLRSTKPRTAMSIFTVPVVAVCVGTPGRRK
jgi:hypothetical protein